MRMGLVNSSRVYLFGFDAEVVLVNGGTLIGLSGPYELEFVSQINYSPTGNNYIADVDTDVGDGNEELMVVNGEVLFAGGAIMREGFPIPSSIGGLAEETYGNFLGHSITDSGHSLIIGVTDAADDLDRYLMIDGVIEFRESDSIGELVLVGPNGNPRLNDSGDWAVEWGVQSKGGKTRRVLILNGRILLIDGDAVDWNNDGLIDDSDMNASVTDFNDLELGERDADGNVRIFFTADVEVDGIERVAGFSMTVDPKGFSLGDVNQDGVINLLDVDPFVDLLTSGDFQNEADINQDGVVNLLDVDPFVVLLSGG